MKISLLGLASLMLTLVACAPAATPTAPAPTSAPPTAEAALPTDAPASTPEDSTPVPAAALPAWQTIPLIDARTGEPFTFADYAGKTVFVHPMAQWCTNCRNSQRTLRDGVVPQLSPDDFVFISLDIEPDSSAADLAAYAEANGFPWRFAVASPDLVAALVQAFGRTVTNPPTQPHFLIAPDGTTGGLLTGSQSPDETIRLLQEAAAGSA